MVKNRTDRFKNMLIIGLRIRTAIVILILSASVPFIISLTGDFVFDDTPAIVKNSDVNSNVSINSLFDHDFWGTPINSTASHKSYRPLTVLIFRLIRNLRGQLDPLPFHVVNIILHVVDTLLAYAIYRIIFGETMRDAAFTSALIFAVHPIHTECVSGIVGQAELLSALFAFCSFLFYHVGCVYSILTWVTAFITILSCFLGFIAMLFKEQGIAILGVSAIYDMLVINLNVWSIVFDFMFRLDHRTMLGNKRYRHGLFGFQYFYIQAKKLSVSYRSFMLRQLIIFIATVVSLAFRWKVMGFQVPVFLAIDNPASHVEDLVSRVLNYNYIYAINAGIILFPKWLCFDWSMGCIPLLKIGDLQNFDWRLSVVFLFWLFLLGLVTRCFLTNNADYRRCLIMGLSFTVILFLPASNILFNVGFVIAERVLYLPSLGFFMIIGIGIFKMSKHMQKISEFVFLVILVILCVRTAERSGQWKNEKLLYESGLSVCPQNAKVHFNVGKIASDSRDIDRAIQYYEQALRLYPDYEQALNNLANMLKETGDLKRAEKILTKAVELNSNFAAAWMNLGIVSVGLKDYDKGMECYTNALRIRKTYPDCYYNIGNLFMEMGKTIEAMNSWHNAISQNNKHAPSWCNLMIMLDSLGEYSKAESIGNRAVVILPNEACIRFNFATTLAKQKNYSAAEYHFLETIKLKPGTPVHHINLAVMYHRWGKPCEAYEHYKTALEITPDSPNAARHRQSMLVCAKACPYVTEYRLN